MTMETMRSKSCFQNLSILLILTISLNNFERAHSWLPSPNTLKINPRHPNPPSPYQHRQQQQQAYVPSSVSPVVSSTRLYRVIIDPVDFPLGRDEDAWKLEGERIILKAVVEAGASVDQIKIQWKAGRIIVTVDGGYAAVKPRDESDVGEEEFGDMDFDAGTDIDTDTDTDDDTEADDADDDDEGLKESPADEDKGANVISIARKINNAFAEEGEESVGFRIAVHHSVEVTTPGASDELDGVMMFKAYKGFDVQIEMIDAKTKKVKIVEGKLVDRTDDTTIINQKGRLRKIKNYNVQSVKLPKAKREKRGR